MLETMQREVKTLLIFKAIVYRILRIILLLITSFLVLGDISTAISISAIDAIVATIYYYYFDKIWDNTIKPIVENARLRVKYRKMK